MNKYKVVEKKGEGTFSEVVQVKHLHTGKYAAIKCMKAKYGNIDEVNDLREIQALRRLSPHPNIVQLYEVLFDRPTGRLALVFEIMDLNLYELIQHRQQRLPGRHVKIYMYQLFQALDFMHKKGIFHRDIKPENILINKSSKTLKLADLGSCRGIYSKPPFTEYISTRWYRAPECLLTSGGYGPEMDVWGAGCVHFEIMTLYPVFPGNDEIDQISRIHKILGTPDHRFIQGLKTRGNSSSCDFIPRKGTGIAPLIPFATKSCIDFVTRALEYKKERRLTAEKAIFHPYFSDKKAKLTISLPQSYDDFASEKKPLHETVGYHSNSLPNIDTGQISNKSKSSSWTERRKVFEISKVHVKKQESCKRISKMQLPSINRYKHNKKGRIRCSSEISNDLVTHDSSEHSISSRPTKETRKKSNKLYKNVQSSGYGMSNKVVSKRKDRLKLKSLASYSSTSSTTTKKLNKRKKLPPIGG